LSYFTKRVPNGLISKRGRKFKEIIEVRRKRRKSRIRVVNVIIDGKNKNIFVILIVFLRKWIYKIIVKYRI